MNGAKPLILNLGPPIMTWGNSCTDPVYPLNYICANFDVFKKSSFFPIENTESGIISSANR